MIVLRASVIIALIRAVVCGSLSHLLLSCTTV